MSAETLNIAAWCGVLPAASSGNLTGSLATVRRSWCRDRRISTCASATLTSAARSMIVERCPPALLIRSGSRRTWSCGRTIKSTQIHSPALGLQRLHEVDEMPTPSGRNFGHRCEFSPREASSSVAGYRRATGGLDTELETSQLRARTRR